MPKPKSKKSKGDGDDGELDKTQLAEKAEQQRRLAAAMRRDMKVGARVCVQQPRAAGRSCPPARRPARRVQNKMITEQRNAAWNEMKIQNTWRKIMRLAKARRSVVAARCEATRDRLMRCARTRNRWSSCARR